jgi:2-methylcitrate dehydratase PrpD
MGASFLAAKLLGCDARQMVDAAGIAGSFAAGLGEGLSDGSWAPLIHAGWAAQSGIAAALLARSGYSGPARVLEGGAGLLRSHVQDESYAFDFAQATTGLGERWESRNISLKPYPCAHVLHAFLDALLALHREGLRADQVRRIICPIADYMIGVVCVPAEEKRAPRSDWQGRGALYYTLAEALSLGRLDAQSYQAASRADPAILGLARKIEHVVDDTAKPGQFKGWVIIETVDGRRLERIESFNRGSAEQPMSDHDIREKFRANAGAFLPAPKIAALEREVANLAGPGAVRRLVAAAIA